MAVDSNAELEAQIIWTYFAERIEFLEEVRRDQSSYHNCICATVWLF